MLGAIEKIAGVKLEARRIGEDFEGAARGRLGDECCSLQGFISPEDIAMIVAMPAGELLMRCADALAERVRLAKIKRRTRYVHQRARRDEHGTYGDDLIGRKGEAVVEDITFAG